jgi:cation diffusion facilitator family transporter
MHDEGSGRRAILAAFAANLGIATAKLLGFAFTGAASMLAESIHSLADTGNQGLLLLGRRRAGRPPSAEHPLGHGRERYFWAFVVALILFTGGSLFALLEGVEKVLDPHPVESVGWAVGILLVAVALEGWSLRTAVREAARQREGMSWWRFIRSAKSPDLPVVLLEDTGAVLGLLLALGGVSLAAVTGDGRYDAAGSIGIGLLLAFIAVTLAVETKSLLIGEAAAPSTVAAVCDVLATSDGVAAVLDLRTEHLGPDQILVVAELDLDPDGDVAARIDRVEARLRARVPEVAFCYLEPVPRRVVG